MIRAYDEALLPLACDSLGRMTDFSVHSLRIDADSMMKLFVASGVAALFGRGDPRTVAGMSGIELAYKVLEASGLTYERTPARHTLSLSNEYRAGHALAYAQWESGLRFEEILERCSVRGLAADCGREKTALLESLPVDISDEDKAEALNRFGDSFSRSFAAKLLSPVGDAGDAGSGDTRLKKIRIKNGLSQSSLAKASGVPLRTLQQYEQRQKDINKARFEYIMMLSGALSCDPADLLERS